MTNSRLARTAAALLGLAALAACSKSSSSTSTAPAPATSQANARPAGNTAAAKPYTAAMVAEGDSIFHARGCKNCHGPDAKGAANGPNLVHPASFLHVDGSYESFVNIITTGVPADKIKDPAHKVPMAGLGGRPTPLTPDQIKAVAAYVYNLNHP
jgi:mono/diheme cytochrome c family protein